MKKIASEFKEFIARGNVMDMAVGIIVGGAFTAIVNSLVTNVIQPLITLVTSTTSSVTGADGVAEETINNLRWLVPGTDQYIDLGAFISAVINFLIIAFVVFLMVKGLNTMRERMDAIAKKEEEVEEAAAPTCPHCLEEVKAGATKCPHCGSDIEA